MDIDEILDSSKPWDARGTKFVLQAGASNDTIPDFASNIKTRAKVWNDYGVLTSGFKERDARQK